MGISYETAWFLSSCTANNNSSPGKVDFSRTITLGRQVFSLSKNECESIINKQFAVDLTAQQKTLFYKKLNDSQALRFPDFKYSEPFFELLGKEKTTVDSLDYSDYEEATIIHDITVPIPNELKNKYTCVFDGGLLEHVYDYPTALKNAMDMLVVGGNLILSTPGNNYFGHGFYQFSPELFYSVLREENGFGDTRVYLCNYGKWYLVQNPRVIHKRTEVSPKWPDALLYVISKRIGEIPDKITAFQSDYEEVWAPKETRANKQSTLITTLMTILKPIYNKSPFVIRKYIRESFYSLTYKKRFKESFSFINLGATSTKH